MSRARREAFDPAPILDRFAGMSAAEIAELLGVTPRTVSRWRNGGTIEPATADRLACYLGMHPVEMWPHEWPRPTGPAR